MRQLFDYIKKYSTTGILEEDFEIVKRYFAPKKLRKKQYFLQEGNVCRQFGFIVNGAMRQYTVDDKGTEHVVQLSVENWWVGDRESYVESTPSRYNIDAWEDTDVLTITRKDMLELFQRCPAFVETLRAMDDKNNIANQRRITSSISSGAEERYNEFVRCHPDLVTRFPQHAVASYLGITKDTLSRIKRQHHAKK